MNKTLKIVLAVTVISFIGCGLVLMGIQIGSSGWTQRGGPLSSYQLPLFSGFRPGYRGYYNNYNGHMMGGHGMMGSYGMMEGDCFSSDEGIKPFTLDEADQIIHEYLENMTNDDLALGEIMIFDNHAYAQIIEDSTGIGAIEILIDPQTKSVYPEHGPNMMWNLKYSSMGSTHSGHGPGMMSGGNIVGLDELNSVLERAENMPISSDQALAAAQVYLDNYQPGTQADEHADPFYGYYTIHVLKDGDVTGMLSVNGLSGQVFFHNWHGEFIQMSDH